MELHRYQRLHVALALSVFVGTFTARTSGAITHALAAGAGFLVFCSLVLFIVGSSSTIHEALAASLGSRTSLQSAPPAHRRAVTPQFAVCLPSTTLVLPFRYQLPPPAQR